MGLLYTNNECNPVTNNNLKVNAVSGTLTKSNRYTFFVKIEKDSVMEHFYFREEKPSRIIEQSSYHYPDYERYNWEYYKLKEIVILQVMLMADSNYLVEAIDKEDYEKLFDIEKVEDR